MLNFAHRGFSGKYPENTMLSFRKAVELGVDGIELDVHFSKDGELVIIHDEEIDRTCDGKGLVRDYTFDQLRQFNASAGFKGVYGKNEIPSLREYFEYIKPFEGIITNIELKTGEYDYPGIEKAVVEMIEEFSLEDRIIISSFNHYSVMRTKALNSNIKCGFLEWSKIFNFGEYTKTRDVECIHPASQTITEENIDEIKSNGISINCWTVNSPQEVKRLFNLGVDGVIGNNPDMVKETLDLLK